MVSEKGSFLWDNKVPLDFCLLTLDIFTSSLFFNNLKLSLFLSCPNNKHKKEVKKITGLKKKNKEKKYWCRFYAICNGFQQESKTCTFYEGDPFYETCGKYRELNQKIKNRKELKKVEVRRPRMEVIREC